MIIREATREDWPAIIGHALEFAASTPPYDTQPDRPTATSVEWLLSFLAVECADRATVLVADEAGTVFGMIALCESTNLLIGERYAEELCWWVAPKARAGLAGPRLLRAAEEWARQRGLTSLKMVAPMPTLDPTSHVGAFYVRAGYRPLEAAYVKAL